MASHAIALPERGGATKFLNPADFAAVAGSWQNGDVLGCKHRRARWIFSGEDAALFVPSRILHYPRPLSSLAFEPIAGSPIIKEGKP